LQNYTLGPGPKLQFTSVKVQHFSPDSKFYGLSELAKITLAKGNESHDET